MILKTPVPVCGKGMFSLKLSPVTASWSSGSGDNDAKSSSSVRELNVSPLINTLLPVF
jgi:hypothetical protein